MLFILLIQRDEVRWAGLCDAERDAATAACEAYTQKLMASGRVRLFLALHSPVTATTLRLCDGRCVLADAPFAETREILAACHLVECRNLDEALDIAAQFPSLRTGASVEVRPVRAAIVPNPPPPFPCNSC